MRFRVQRVTDAVPVAPLSPRVRQIDNSPIGESFRLLLRRDLCHPWSRGANAYVLHAR